MCGLHEVDPQGSTEPLSGSDAGDTGQEAGEASMDNLFPMDHEATPEPASLSGRFGTAQLEDPNLTSALQQVTVVDGKAIEGVGLITYPHFAIKNKLLYQVIKRKDECVELLLVPRPFVQSVLQLAHSHLLGGSVSTPSSRGGEDPGPDQGKIPLAGGKEGSGGYCGSCPECQQVAPKPHFCGPLIPLPIISVPFSRIAMDLVGPLPKSSRGHQYILVILDYATRYPEAIPLRTMASKGIARELVLMFSRVDIPEEILTD